MWTINYHSSFLSEEEKTTGVKYMISNYSDEELLNLMVKFLSEGYKEYYILAKQEVLFRMGCSVPYDMM